MRVKDFSIISGYDGLVLGLTTVEADDCIGVVLLHHGMTESRKPYIPFSKYLANNGFTCIISDYRGHGISVASGDDLGYFDARGLIADMRQINALAREKYPQKPIFLFGHSMGSLAARAYTRLYDNTINGLIVCGSPSENSGVGIAKALCDLISAFKGDRHRSQFFYAVSVGAYKKRAQRKGLGYEEEDACDFKFTVKGYKALFELMQNAYAKKGWGINNRLLPVLFISGSEDPCLITRRKFFSSVNFMREKYPNTASKLYSGEHHELLNCPQKEQVYKDVLSALTGWVG